MPYFVQRLALGRTTWEIDYRDGRSRMSERLGRETARIEITDAQASLGIDELLRLATSLKTASVG